MKKSYHEPIKSEEETTINVLYKEQVISVYTNKVDLQRKLLKVLGKPSEEYKRKQIIYASRWNIPMSEKSKISQMILKANIYEL